MVDVIFFSFIFYLCLFKVTGFLFLKDKSTEAVAEKRPVYLKYDYIIAALLYTLLIIIFYHPFLHTASRAVIGPAGDNIVHLWDMWWAHKVWQGEGSLSFSRYIFYPEGTSLLYQAYSFYNIVLSLFFRNMFNPIVVYNILIIHTFLLSGIGAFFLARYLTRNSYLGMLAGFVFAFNPYNLLHSMYQIEVVSCHFLPFFVLFFIRSIRDNSKKDIFFASLFFLLNALCNWYYLIYAIYFILFGYGYIALKNRRFLIKGYLIKSAMAIIPTFLIVSPWLIKMLIAGLKAPELGFYHGYNIYLADAAGLFLPHPYHILSDLKIVEGLNSKIATINFNYERVVYLGIINMFVMAAVFKRALAATAKYLMGLMAFILLAMGEYIHILGRSLPIILPHHIIKLMPFISQARAPSRFMVFAYLFLSIITAFSFKYVWERLKPIRKGALVLSAILILLVADYYFVFGYAYEIKTKARLPKCYAPIVDDKSDFGILDLPDAWCQDALYMFYQTYHGIPIVQGYLARRLGGSLIDRLDFINLENQKRQLKENRVKYIVIHKNLESPQFLKRRPIDKRIWEKFAFEKENIDMQKYKKQYVSIYEDENNIVFKVY